MTQSFVTSSGFNNLGIDPRLLFILKNNSFINPTPIQKQCIPHILYGDDIVGIAQTGTGKTLAFALPVIQNLKEKKGQALVLVPTRELAIQAEEMIFKIGRTIDVRTAVVIGGASIGRQIMDLRRNPDIIIATPGRLLDHLKRGTFNLKQIKIVILDEADRMFDIGFLPDIKSILSLSPSSRQTLLFSATISSEIAQITSKFMKTPVRVEVAPSGTVASGVEQEIFILKREEKLPLLKKILSDNSGTALVFVKTKHGVKRVAKTIISMGHNATEIHSDRSLFQRKEAMKGFKSGKYRVLVATDIASRGIDVSNISLVINYDLPENSEDYVHRIGRTGRAGKEGKAISFASSFERNNIRKIERLIKKNISISKLPNLPILEIPLDMPIDDRRDRRKPFFRKDKKNSFSRKRSYFINKGRK